MVIGEDDDGEGKVRMVLGEWNERITRGREER